MARRGRVWRWLGVMLIGLVAVLGAGVALLKLRYPAVEGWDRRQPPAQVFVRLDPWIKGAFADPARPRTDRFEDLFRYFVEGFLAYREAGGARAYYPGLPSGNGRPVDGLEGFARTAPLMAAWLAGGRPATIERVEGGQLDLVALLAEGLASGSDPASPHYWGEVGDLDQRLVEAADIALALWLGRDSLWPALPEAVKGHLLAWLSAAAGQETYDNVWRLFPLQIDRILKSLGGPHDDAAFAAGWQAFREMYLGDGWFADGERGADYYNAWGIHYALAWLSRIAPGFDGGFLDEVRPAFAESLAALVAPEGIPLFGRSLCYRTAVPAPLVLFAEDDPALVAPGQAARALEAVWGYFLSERAVMEGRLTQGYCADDPRVLDHYSGPASCLWGLRSLVAALAAPRDAALWTAPELPLPVERGSFSLAVPALDWTIVGEAPAGRVTLLKPGPESDPPLEDYGPLRHAAELLLERPFRPNNEAAKREGARYSNDPPFCGCL